MDELGKYFIKNNWTKINGYSYYLMLPNRNRVEVILKKEKGLAKRVIYFSDGVGNLSTPYWEFDFILYSLKSLMERFD
jgi:hypothetical protein